MRYLFFDLEFASTRDNVRKICEFGYVVTDEDFDLIEKGNMIIDPVIKRSEWDRYVIKKILTRPVDEYLTHPDFPSYYGEIKRLFGSADFVLGHSVDSDVRAVNDECKRFSLPAIDFDFYDIKRYYKKLTNGENDTGLAKMLDELNIPRADGEHDAGIDAYNTMLAAKGMLASCGMSLGRLIDAFPDFSDRTENFVISSISRRKKTPPAAKRTQKAAKTVCLRYGNTNTFLVGNLLIDTDMAGTMKDFRRELKNNDMNMQNVRYVFATHYHPDHVGNVGKLMQAGVKLILLENQKGYVHSSDGIFARRPKTEFAPIDEDAAIVVTAEESRELLASIGIMGQIVPTFSHSPDGAALILDDGNAFVGDLEPREYIDGYDDNEALAEDWKRVLGCGAEVIHYGHIPEKAQSGEAEEEK